jgi:tetratricopeptide (TPR) repeat protein
LVFRGNARVQQGQVDEALADLNKAAELAPESPDVRLHRGNAFKAKDDLDAAIQNYTEAIQINAEFADAYSQRAAAYLAKGNAEEALNDFTAFIKLTPESPAGYIQRAVFHRGRGEAAEALADFTKAIELNGEQAESHQGLAWLLATSPKDDVRNAEEAVNHATKACQLTEEKDLTCLETLAAAFAEAQKLEDAVATQKKVLESENLSQDDRTKAEERLKLYEAGKPYRVEL